MPASLYLRLLFTPKVLDQEKQLWRKKNTKCLKNSGKAVLASCSAPSNNEDRCCIEMEALEVGGIVVVVVASEEVEKK